MIHVLLKQKTNRGFKWCRSDRTYACGYAFIDGEYSEGPGISQYLEKSVSTDEFKKRAAEVNGIFSAIYVNKGEAAAIVDKYGVHKLFYSQKGNDLYVGDDVETIARTSGNSRINRNSEKDWIYSGFSVYDETLIENIKSLNASGFLVYKKDYGVATSNYHQLKINPTEASYEQLLEKLPGIVRDLSQRLVASLDGRKAIVPLSGGVDSRFCLLLLKVAGYRNVLCITYGRSNGKEEVIAQRTAETCGYKFLLIPYKRSSWAALFKNKDNLDYINYASDFKATPHFQDLFAARCLASMKGSEDFVIIPGHVGSIAESIMMPGTLYAKDDFLDIFIRKYFYYYGFKTKKIIDYLKKRLSDYYTEKKPADDISAQEMFDKAAYDTYRSNHLMMALKPYDYYGFKWRLPLVDEELVSFFESVPLQYKEQKKILLLDFVADSMENSPEYYSPSQTYMGKVIKNIMDRRYSCIKPHHVFKLKKDMYNLPAVPKILYRYYRNYLSYVSAETLRYLMNRIENEEI